mgnify:CR=1 FL=1
MFGYLAYYIYNKNYIKSKNNNYKLRDGRLADIAPTILDLMGIEKPREMTGESIIHS